MTPLTATTMSAPAAADARRALRHVALAALVFWIACVGLSVHRHRVFYTSYDQGIFNQVFWNGLHGRLFQGSLSASVSYAVTRQGEPPSVAYRRLGQHFTPTLALWLPVYALWPSPLMLSMLQVTLVTIAGLVLYALARTRLAAPVSAMIAIAYYCAHAVIGPTVSNFHDICQLPLYLFAMFLAVERRRWGIAWALVVLILGVREDAGIPLVGVGLYLLASRRHLRVGGALVAASVAWMLFVTNVVMPRISPDISGRFMVEQFGGLLGQHESTTLGLLRAMLGQPARVLIELVTPVVPTLHYLVRQWLPVAFVPALTPAGWLLAGPGLIAVFVQEPLSVLSLNVRYAMTVVPGLFYGVILWWSQHPALAERLMMRRFWLACMGVSLVTTLVANPHQVLSFVIPDSVQPWVYVSLPRQWQRAALLDRLVARVPPDASVSATTHVVPQLSGRRAVTRLPQRLLRDDAGQTRPVDFVIADAGRSCEYLRPFPADHARLAALLAVVDQVVRDERYGLLEVADGIAFLQRGVPADPGAVAEWGRFRTACLGGLAEGRE
jgi:uncharacterized membrane protein